MFQCIRSKIYLLPSDLSLYPFHRLIVESNVYTRIVFANSAFSKVTGIPSEDLIGKSLTDILDDESFHVHNNSKRIFLKHHGDAVDCCSNFFSVITFQVKDKSQITHFVLDFFSEPCDESEIKSNSTIGSAATTAGHLAKPFNAVG